jgi:hypothetical protein
MVNVLTFFQLNFLYANFMYLFGAAHFFRALLHTFDASFARISKRVFEHVGLKSTLTINQVTE